MRAEKAKARGFVRTIGRCARLAPAPPPDGGKPALSRPDDPSRAVTPLRWLLDLFSSVWTGIALLVLLFVYSSLGSAVPGLRQARFFEMTEYEWFHAWPFGALIGLICLTLVVTTVRRIPFKPVNYGVWMIHSGIIILAASSVVYFSTKVEGDAPVVRRHLRVAAPGADPVTVVAMPGNSALVGTPDRPYQVQVASIDPQWEILSGEDAGRRAYSVNVLVQSPDRTFIRQLLAGYPQYTEDLVRSTDGGRPWTRARKVLDQPIVDDQLEIELAYEPQEWFYLSNDMAKSWALYLREVAAERPPGPWVERPIVGMPLYNDYVADPSDVWPPVSRAHPLRVEIPAARESDDPLADTKIIVTSYLRYAVMDTRRGIGGPRFDPAVRVRVETAAGRGREYQLVALDPVVKAEEQGRLVFEWVESEAAYEAIVSHRPPRLTIRVPGVSGEMDVEIDAMARRQPNLPFAPIEGTEYRYRVQTLHDGLRLPTGDVISVAVVEMRTPKRSFVRWVCDDPTKTRDMAAGDEADPHAEAFPLDTNIVMEYVPGAGPVAPITLVGGPEADDLRLVLATGDGPPQAMPITVREPLALNENLRLTVLQFSANTSLQTKPAIVPREQRNRDVRARLSMIQVEVPGPAGPKRHWLHFHDWPIEGPSLSLRRVAYRPTEVQLADGRRVELMFSRRRQRLPAAVALDDFLMDTHVGGFTGENLSILNWTSRIRFREEEGWGEPLDVSVNAPRESGGLWFFQAQWDPPDPAEAYNGLNFTVLGVGNRRGVRFMLLGCCVTVAGMIYAFYIKPLIKRRRRQAVYAQATAARPREAVAGLDAREPEPVAAAGGRRR